MALAESCQTAAQLGQAMLCAQSLCWGGPLLRLRSATASAASAPLLPIDECAVAAAARMTASVHAVCCALRCSACSQVAAHGPFGGGKRLAAQCRGGSTG